MIFAVSFGALGSFIGALIHGEMRQGRVSRRTIIRLDIAMAIAVTIPTVVMGVWS